MSLREFHENLSAIFNVTEKYPFPGNIHCLKLIQIILIKVRLLTQVQEEYLDNSNTLQEMPLILDLNHPVS